MQFRAHILVAFTVISCGSPRTMDPGSKRIEYETSPSSSQVENVSPEPSDVASSEEPVPRAPQETPPAQCDPKPRVGAACDSDGHYCVLSWGEPGGKSSALVCREGKWLIEEEANLEESRQSR